MTLLQDNIESGLRSDTSTPTEHTSLLPRIWSVDAEAISRVCTGFILAAFVAGVFLTLFPPQVDLTLARAPKWK